MIKTQPLFPLLRWCCLVALLASCASAASIGENTSENSDVTGVAHGTDTSSDVFDSQMFEDYCSNTLPTVIASSVELNLPFSTISPSDRFNNEQTDGCSIRATVEGGEGDIIELAFSVNLEYRLTQPTLAEQQDMVDQNNASSSDDYQFTGRAEQVAEDAVLQQWERTSETERALFTVQSIGLTGEAGVIRVTGALMPTQSSQISVRELSDAVQVIVDSLPARRTLPQSPGDEQDEQPESVDSDRVMTTNQFLSFCASPEVRSVVDAAWTEFRVEPHPIIDQPSISPALEPFGSADGLWVRCGILSAYSRTDLPLSSAQTQGHELKIFVYAHVFDPPDAGGDSERRRINSQFQDYSVEEGPDGFTMEEYDSAGMTVVHRRFARENTSLVFVAVYYGYRTGDNPPDPTYDDLHSIAADLVDLMPGNTIVP